MAESNIEALKQTEAPTTEWCGKRRGFKFKKGRNSSLNKKQNTGSTTSSSQGSSSILPCSECGACYRYGKVGHMVKDCPSAPQGNSKAAASAAASTAPLKPNPKATRKEPMRQGQVFALVPGDVQNTETVVSVNTGDIEKTAFRTSRTSTTRRLTATLTDTGVEMGTYHHGFHCWFTSLQ
ncbi:hypothetical protein CsSME_00032984 [Camellia sinensis var. sinensis]